MIRGKNPRYVLVTMNMFNGQPVLVKSSQVYEVHSDVLLVKQIIKKLAQKHHIYAGCGLRSLTDVEDMLKSSVCRCVVASADDVLITKIPKERLVVEISINEQNEVLIHGRQTNTHSFDRVVPQLGSAIWKIKLTIGSIFNSMINFNDNGTVSGIIQDVNGPVKGLCYMNRESIKQTCQHRKLYRYARKLGRVIMKGETSGDVQHIIQISLDCDSGAMLITVDSKKPFCHTGNHSCFCIQASIKANLATLTEHIKSKINDDSYTGIMQRNPQLALAKVTEEFWEVIASH
ncbi:unnamed protein product [Rotaria sp. Silwood2]|nr:unnamed protein product [Rotaria sp. Silwood2]